MSQVEADEELQDYLTNLRRRVAELEEEQHQAISAAAARRRQLDRDLWRRGYGGQDR